MASITPNQFDPNPYDAIIEDQKLQAMHQEIASIDERLDAMERETEETNIRAQLFEKRVNSLNTVSNVALTVVGVVALSILEPGVRYIWNRYFN